MSPGARPYDVITFDCYGTLIDWEQGIFEAFSGAAAAAGHTVTRDAVLAAHADIEPAVQAGGYQRYRDVLRSTAVGMAARLGWELPVEQAGFLPEGLAHWKPFPDTNPALQALAARGFSLGILTNIDDDLLAATLRHLVVDFDLVITAEQVRSYKPAHGHFRAAQAAVGDRRWLHAAQSWFHDIEPAYALGVPAVWINRKGERPRGNARPAAAFPTLHGLVDWLARPNAMTGPEEAPQ